MKEIIGKNPTHKCIALTFCLMWSVIGMTQNSYQSQISALQSAFVDKSIEPFKSHISADLAFGPIPKANTPNVLTSVFSKFPTLKKLEILETSKSKVLVRYDFESLGESESSIHFDEDGKVVKIEFIENIILQEIAAQKALSESVQSPVPGALGDKYQPTAVNFEANDGLTITANLYETNPAAPTILLCHQAGYNKFEYADIAPKLCAMGFNCLAIDNGPGGHLQGLIMKHINRQSNRVLKRTS